MAIKGAKTIAEYKIRKALIKEGVQMDFFTLTMNGNEGELTDQCGARLLFVYDPGTGAVREKEYRGWPC